jgi:hypothetical protein
VYKGDLLFLRDSAEWDSVKLWLITQSSKDVENFIDLKNTGINAPAEWRWMNSAKSITRFTDWAPGKPSGAGTVVTVNGSSFKWSNLVNTSSTVHKAICKRGKACQSKPWAGAINPPESVTENSP